MRMRTDDLELDILRDGWLESSKFLSGQGPLECMLGPSIWCSTFPSTNQSNVYKTAWAYDDDDYDKVCMPSVPFPSSLALPRRKSLAPTS
jgi:hypothetical protein